MTVYAPGTLETDPKKQNMALQEHARQIDVSTAGIATNTANIATNTANIATNTTNIATNTADIATNTSAISANTSDLAALKAAWTSYTPSLSAGSGTFTSASAAGKYLQIGKTVFLRVVITITTAGTAGGSVTVSLPAAPNGWAVFTGKEGVVNGKAFGGSSNSNASLALTNYDNTSPIANGAVLVLEGLYETT